MIILYIIGGIIAYGLIGCAVTLLMSKIACFITEDDIFRDDFLIGFFTVVFPFTVLIGLITMPLWLVKLVIKIKDSTLKIE